MSKDPSGMVSVRVPQHLKAELEAEAAREGLSLPDYVRRHFQELLMQRKIHVDTGAMPNSRIQVPYGGYPPPYGYQPPYPPQSQSGRSHYWGGGAYWYPPPLDETDQMLSQMRKMVLIRVMERMLSGASGYGPEAYVMAAQGKLPGQQKNGEDFSMRDMMRMSMMQQQHERSMMMAMQQLEMARRTGDKGAENQAVQLMTALMANQSGQQNQMWTQMMGLQQTAQTAQSQLFNTAMQTNRGADADARQREREFQVNIETLRQQFQTAQLQTLQQMNQQHVDHLKLEMERIRTERPKDSIEQMAKLLDLRKTSPVYKAAFDAAFNIKDESMISKLLPQLKELGVDKVVDGVVTFLTGMISKPKIPAPGVPAATPAQIPSPIPLPPPPPAGTPLEKLKLPGTGTPPAAAEQPSPPRREFTPTPIPPENLQTSPTVERSPATTQATKLPENAVGYTNLDVEKKEEPTPPPPPPPQEQKEKEHQEPL